MKTSLSLSNAVLDRLSKANNELMRTYPGEPEARQPVHTVYGGAQLFKASTAKKMGEIAMGLLEEYAPDAATLAEAMGIGEDPALRQAVFEGVKKKIAAEAVEDFRIDFEDGYGNRPDAEEDGHAVQAAQETAQGMKEGTLSPFIGIRIKPLTEELRARSLRTLDLYLSTLLEQAGGKLPSGFVVTLPKITAVEQIETLVLAFEQLEAAFKLPAGTLKMELMVETTQSIYDHHGRIALPGYVIAGKGRISGAHFGTYDYTAGCNITAAHQHMQHPACQFAKNVMKVALAGTGVMLSDGATTVMPVAPHKKPKEGGALSGAQLAENRTVVHRSWKVAYLDTRDSLINGFYQGWDLHPGQLISRYAAVYTFFLEGYEPAANRLRAFMDKAFQATLSGDMFDDAATGQGLLNYFLRAINCGATTPEAVAARTGMTVEEIRLRSFARILKGRRTV